MACGQKIFSFCVLAITLQFGSSQKFNTITRGCAQWRSVVEGAMMTTAVSYLSDHPRNDEKSLNPQSIQPFTPTRLFEIYYGQGASHVEFKSAMLDLIYAAQHTGAKEDRVRMRRDIYLLAKAGSSKLAREKMGTLLSSVLSDFAGSSFSLDKPNACIPGLTLDDAFKAIGVEFARLRNEIGEAAFARFLGIGIGSTLAFVIDDTGSMSGEIQAVKSRVQEIANQLQNTLDRPQDFVLVPFNDPTVGPATVTTDVGTFQNKLRMLRAHGGGDREEMCMGGIQLAIESSRPGATLYVITDVDAKDYKLQDSVISEAKRKQITVTFMLTNEMSFCRPSTGNYKICMELYRHVAQETGGSVFVVPRNDIFKATEIVQKGIKQGTVLIKRQKVSQASSGRITFPVDRTMDQVLLEAQGNCGEVTVYDTTGKTAANLQSLGNLYWGSANVDNYGEWAVGIGASGDEVDCTVKITAKSTIGFLLRVMKEEKAGSYRIVNGNPSPTDSLAFVLDSYGLESSKESDQTDRVTTIRFLNEFGDNVMKPIEVEKDVDLTLESLRNVFKGGLGDTPSFYYTVEGVDVEGNRFTRMIPRLIATSVISVGCDLSGIAFPPASTVNVSITVHNGGPNDTFVFAVRDSKDYAKIKGSSNRFIPTGEDRKFAFRLTAPPKAKDGESSSITVSARGKQLESFQYDVCTAIVGQKRRPKIHSLYIKGIVNSRFAETVVTSVVVNNADVGREAEFDIMLPADAFIVNMTMKLESEFIVGEVEEKKKAKKVYDKAKKTGKAAGHVAARDSSNRVYRTSLYVEPRKNVTFQLTYQQLLKRVRGQYKYSISISPDQPIKRLIVDVHIVEEKPLTFVSVPPFATDQTSKKSLAEPPGTSITYNRHRRSCRVLYSPTITQQTEFSPFGLSGTFQIQYDVERSQMYGDVTLNNGYFAHFFAPPSLPVMPKIVTYIIDTSGSMFGYKMVQMREALATVLREMNKDDYFNIVFFNDDATPWIRMIMSPATATSVEDAIEVINKVQPTGGTNMLAAFRAAFDLMEPYLPELPSNESNTTTASPLEKVHVKRSLEKYNRIRKRAAVTQADTEKYAKMMVFVTDGRPSVGEINVNTIIERVERLNQDRLKIHTLGFGTLANMKLLNKIAAVNGGVSRRVFETLDATTQIQDFFEEVTNPLMTDVLITYPLQHVKDLTSNTFSVFTAGSELVLAGKIRTDEDLLDGGEEILLERTPRQIHGRIVGKTFEDEMELDFDVDTTLPSTHIATSQHKIKDFTERLWAFLKVKDLLQQAAYEDNETKAENIKEQALNMSLKYNFVTPLTSLVVLRPEDRERIEEELRREEKDRLKKEEQERKRLEAEEARRREEEESERKRLEEDSGSAYGEIAYDASVHYHRSKSLGRSFSGGFYGDPHFIISLGKDINLCFNWDGHEGEIYNLLHDPVSGTTVNGELIGAPSLTDDHVRTYISRLSITIPSKIFKLLVEPETITLIPRGAKNFTFRVTSDMRFLRDGVELRIYDVKPGSARLEVSIDDIIFQVILNRNIHHTHRKNHLDFSVINKNDIWRSPFFGVIGQFLGSDVSMKDGRRAGEKKMKIKDRVSRVVQYERMQPGTEDRIPCWYAHRNARDLIEGAHHHYLVEDIMAIPRFTFK